MDQERLGVWLGQVLRGKGFHGKSNEWRRGTGELTKIVGLQKSQFSNALYINFGYNIDAVKIPGMRLHIAYRLGSHNVEERRRINDLLDLDSDMDEIMRWSELESYVLRTVLGQLDRINTEAELRADLLRRPDLNSVPLAVKERLQLP
jgi:hypothetical protein